LLGLHDNGSASYRGYASTLAKAFDRFCRRRVRNSKMFIVTYALFEDARSSELCCRWK
jgi:hypothetical protein